MRFHRVPRSQAGALGSSVSRYTQIRTVDVESHVVPSGSKPLFCPSLLLHYSARCPRHTHNDALVDLHTPAPSLNLLKSTSHRPITFPTILRNRCVCCWWKSNYPSSVMVTSRPLDPRVRRPRRSAPVLRSCAVFATCRPSLVIHSRRSSEHLLLVNE